MGSGLGLGLGLGLGFEHRPTTALVMMHGRMHTVANQLKIGFGVTVRVKIWVRVEIWGWGEDGRNHWGGWARGCLTVCGHKNGREWELQLAAWSPSQGLGLGIGGRGLGVRLGVTVAGEDSGVTVVFTMLGFPLCLARLPDRPGSPNSRPRSPVTVICNAYP